MAMQTVCSSCDNHLLRVVPCPDVLLHQKRDCDNHLLWVVPCPDVLLYQKWEMALLQLGRRGRWCRQEPHLYPPAPQQQYWELPSQL
jgi:hypothetical protein